VNVTGLNALIEHLDEGAPVLYISSSEVYSGLGGPPFEEWQIGTTDPGHVRAPYIEGKRAGEAIALAATRTGRIQASVARLALAYGPGTRKDDSRVLNEFIRGAVASGAIRMRDAGMGMRTYCYVKDAVDMMLWLVSEQKHGVFNVGGESRISIRGLAELIASMCGAELDVPSEPVVGSPGAPDDVWLSLDKVRGEGYSRVLTPLEVGLKQTIAWQRDHLYREEAEQ
jgi:nucleoside-diphosphate-sugar epimerase